MMATQQAARDDHVRISLRLKLSLLITLLLVLTILLISAFLLRQAERGLTTEMTKRGLTHARDLANSAKSFVLAGDELSLSLLVSNAARDPDVAYVVVTEPEGKIVAHPDLGQVGKRFERSADLRPLGDEVLVETIVLPEHGRVIDIATPLMFRGVRVGALYLGFSRRSIDWALSRARMQTLLISAAMVLLAVAGAASLAAVLARPIQRLVDGTRAIATGNFDVSLPVPSRDEIGLLTESFNQMARSLREKDMIKRAFSRYVAREVVNEILKDPESLVLKEERRDVTVLFCEIRGFTHLAEQLSPAEVVRLLNDFYGQMIDATFKHDGTLNEFFGDGVMAFFGAPIPNRDHALHAVRTALAMRAGIRQLSQERVREGRMPITLGVGVHAGEVVAGTVGTEDRMKYAVVGDNVNLAARLLSSTSPDQILISQATYERVKDSVDARSLGMLQLKGKQSQVEVFEVVSLAGPA
jgi:adenylate cyclase